MPHEIYVKRGDQIRGPISPEKFSKLVENGKLVPKDLFSNDPGDEWQRLDVFLQAQKRTQPPKSKVMIGAVSVFAVALACMAAFVFLRPEPIATDAPLATENSDVRIDVAKIPSQSVDNGGWRGWPTDAPPPAIAPFDSEQAKQHQEEWARYLELPVEFKNSMGMKFRLIPPGKFTMGTTKEAFERVVERGLGQEWRDRVIPQITPRHEVYLTQPFYLGIYEVTQQEFEKIMGANPSHFSSSGAGKSLVDGLDTANHPVETMTWTDISVFCDRLSSNENLGEFYGQRSDGIAPVSGIGYRLPTEAQWEFACRAGTTTFFWNGDRDEDLAKVGWFLSNSGRRTLRWTPFIGPRASDS